MGWQATAGVWLGTVLSLSLACGDDGGGDTGNDGGSSGTSSPATSSPSQGSDDADSGSGTNPSTSSATTATTMPPADSSGGADGSSDSTGAAGEGCDAGDYIACVDFESATLGGFPDGWGLRPSGVWGGNSIGVTDEDAAHGSQALKIEGSNVGAQWMTYMGDVTPLADGHWGRMYFRMGTPIPWPGGGVIHGDVFEARGNWNGSTHQVRWAAIENNQMKHNWGYNVQTSNAGEFIFETSYVYDWPGDWFCIEWHHDQGAQQATLWVEGEEILAVTSDQDPQLPSFDDISVGWANYQDANPQFVVYIDDVVLDDERVGCAR